MTVCATIFNAERYGRECRNRHRGQQCKSIPYPGHCQSPHANPVATAFSDYRIVAISLSVPIDHYAECVDHKVERDHGRISHKVADQNRKDDTIP